MVNEWSSAIEASPDHSTVIDLAIVLEKLLCRTMVIITFGEDISDLEIEMDVRTGPGSSEFVRKSLPLAQAAREFDDAVFDHAPFKWQSRWYQGLRSLTGIKHFTSHHRTLAGNG